MYFRNSTMDSVLLVLSLYTIGVNLLIMDPSTPNSRICRRAPLKDPQSHHAFNQISFVSGRHFWGVGTNIQGKIIGTSTP